MRNAEGGGRNAESKAMTDSKLNDRNAPDLKKRTKRFALDVIQFVESLPSGETSRVLGRQLLRSGTSVGANYRAAKRAKSTADFISKMGTVEEEADESAYWIELLMDSGKVRVGQDGPLLREANEVLGITVAPIDTAQRNTRCRALSRLIPRPACGVPRLH